MAAAAPGAFVHRFVHALESSHIDTVRASFDSDVRACSTNGYRMVEAVPAASDRFRSAR